MDKLKSVTVQIYLDNGRGIINGGRYDGAMVRVQVYIPALLNNMFIQPSSEVIGVLTMFINGEWAAVLQVKDTLESYFLPTEDMIEINAPCNGEKTGRYLDVEKNAKYAVTKQAVAELTDWLTVGKL